MMSKEQDVAQSSISPVLFLSVEGTPMSFYLRPGPVKVKLQPLITAGGGTLCNVQQPGAILLVDPAEESSIDKTTAHWYVSTKYINDCIEHNKQLNLDDYKLDSSVAKKYSTRVGNNNKPSYTALFGGRQHYTPEEDAAIINCVSKYKKGLRGSLIWKTMEMEGVTGHSWQSMKYRYTSHLAKKAVNEATADNVHKIQQAKEQMVKNSHKISEVSSTAADAVAPHTDDAETESRQDNIPPTENIQPDTVENEQVVEYKLEDTDESDWAASPQPESPGLCPAEDCPHPLRTRSAHGQLLHGLSSPNGGCGQSASSAELPTASPKLSRKTKSSVQSPLRSATAEEEPPLKKAKGDNVATVAQVHQAANPKTRHSEAASTPQEGEKNKEKVKLGILEFATREFESESDDDSTEEGLLESTNAIPGCSTWNPSAFLEVPCAHRANLQDNQEDGQNNEAEEDVQENQTSQHQGGFQAATSTAVPVSAKAHLFIFDRESQEVESLFTFAERPAALARLQQMTNSEAAHSLSQIQLEEDGQRIMKLMEETKQDLVTVTKALLKTSGDFAEAHDLLLDPLSSSGMLWQCSDDDHLISGDRAVRLQLQEKYGEELVAKRVVFLELEQ